ncbi:MAG: hypothetical protein UR80_C0010G0006 [Parcubacteria group bacterium GW2011_GWB1_35_5]|nr:MAG: hypothetical protein UR50_C0005G0031 [Parcubacteria group bacterium GW2011_GWC1_34_10]KKP81057.1 MAG: hypothetical protein UR80_C0010G0006 [Parcubacteria group bacterium GW2011_GWB1_35_5]OHA86636.1 MAG: hypothetical protein A2726_02145 [Candidatus Zambryskibacteria bacterium RIFCSPHIGHO2_01_FULL_35_32]
MNLSKKVTTLILIITFIFSPVFSIKAEAQWVVLDPANLVQSIAKVVKDYGLDGLAWQITNIIIERMSASTVKWINSGFKGSPAYVTDPESYFTKIGDDLSVRYIFSNPNLDFLCEPIRAKIRIALQSNYYLQDERWRCSLTDVVDNIDDFMNDFERGGWDGFFELTQKPQNNPLGAYMMAENDLMREVAAKVDIATQELNQGQGFMSFKECEIWGEDIVVPGYPGDPTRPERRTKVCLKEVTNTPGSVISEQLNKQLGLGSDKLAVADEFNEIISGLLNQLVSAVFSGIGGGLRGLSSPSSTAEPSLQQRLATTSPQLDYFNKPADTSILDKPVPDPYCLDDINSSIYPDADPNVCEFPRDTVELWPTDPSQTPPIP